MVVTIWLRLSIFKTIFGIVTACHSKKHVWLCYRLLIFIRYNLTQSDHVKRRLVYKVDRSYFIKNQLQIEKSTNVSRLQIGRNLLLAIKLYLQILLLKLGGKNLS
jgi:hypothetical protein